MLSLITTILLLSMLQSASARPPYFQNPPTFEVRDESEPINSTLFNLTGIDNDNDQMTFSLNSPETEDLLRLFHHPQTGNTRTVEVILKKMLDRDREPNRRVLSFLLKSSTDQVSLTVFLLIDDINDVAPVFTKAGYRIVIPENTTVNEVVETVEATDPDLAYGRIINYGLNATGQGAADYKYMFTINNRTGNVSLNGSLDYEERTFYQYEVSAWDFHTNGVTPENYATPVDLFIAIKDIQDTPPVFRNLPYTASIFENATNNTKVLKVEAYDGDIGDSNDLKYSFVGDSPYFSIDLDTGVITTAGPLDADSKEIKQTGGVVSITVNTSEVVEAGQTQLGSTSATTVARITINDVNDNVPKFSRNSVVATVQENAPVGVPLALNGSVTVEDKDMTPENNLFVLNVEMDGIPYMAFSTVPDSSRSVSSTSIMITVNNTKLLDYEERNNITFQIVARESQSLEKQFTSLNVLLLIEDVNDNSPVFDNNPYTFSVLENATIGEVVGTVRATDEDEGDYGSVFYKLQDGEDYFNISTEDGTIAVARRLDRETRARHTITVVAYDNKQDESAQRSGQTRVTVEVEDVNDEPPTFASNTLTIPLAEDVANGTVVTRVTATDKDEGINQEIEYFIGTGGNVTGKFAVNKTTGVVKVADSLRGITGLLKVQVGARDKGVPPLKGFHNLFFSVRDVNLHAPTFTNPLGNYSVNNPYVITIDEEQPLNSTIITLSASDQDKGPNGRVYFFTEPDANGDFSFFKLVSNTGVLYNSARLDRERQPELNILVSAQDDGRPQLKTTLPIRIVLNDIDDNPPSFEKTEGFVELEENTLACVNTSLRSFAFDKDDENTTMCFYIQNGNQPETRDFSIDQATGELCLSKPLDKEKIDRVNMMIKVSKNCSLNGTPDLLFNKSATDKTTFHLIVMVKDINDNPPNFTRSDPSTGILYDTPEGTIVYDLREDVRDKDTDRVNNLPFFRSLGQSGVHIPTDPLPFVVHKNGSVETKRLFSSSMLGHVVINIEAYDIGNLTDTAAFKIYVISNLQRVKLSFNGKDPETVRQFKLNFIRELETAADFNIVVDKIVSSGNGTHMYIHATNKSTDEPVSAEVLNRVFDFNAEAARVLYKYGVYDATPVIQPPVTEDTSARTMMILLVLGCIVLGIIAISLSLALCLIRGKYMRRLQAERTSASLPRKEKSFDPPGTNVYAASNPMYLKEISVEQDAVSNDSLDDNVVEGSDYDHLDEQEITMRIDGPDSPNKISSTTLLDNVLGHLDNEKVKEDKKTLIDDDGDSGTYNSIRGLEHTDI